MHFCLSNNSAFIHFPPRKVIINKNFYNYIMYYVVIYNKKKIIYIYIYIHMNNNNIFFYSHTDYRYLNVFCSVLRKLN